ncbi:MAG TPA: LysR family transcriptional regulator [Polyangiales bacterium]
MNAVHDDFALAKVDLNLLVVFDVLARERSVTRAAERLGVTQSALSHALRRLRALLRDPLLVRGHGGMLLTPRAEALIVPLRSGLHALSRALHEQTAFDPGSARRTFTIASPDLFDVLVVPALLARVRELAPNVDINIVSHAAPELAQRLETGDVDLAVVPHVDRSRSQPPLPRPQGLLQKTLFRDRYACLLRSDHPALKKRTLTLQQYASLSHALVAPRGDGLGQVDEALAERGLRRRIALRMPHFLAALAIVARSDLVLTAPTALAAVGDPGLGVTAIAAPLPLPSHSINLLWHERFDTDPALRWLRTLLSAEARDQATKLGLVGRHRP